MVSVRDIAVNKMGKDTTLVKLMLGVRLTDIKRCGSYKRNSVMKKVLTLRRSRPGVGPAVASSARTHLHPGVPWPPQIQLHRS